MSTPLWQPGPQQIERSNLTVFMRQLERDYGISCRDYADLYAFSITDLQRFWDSVWRFCRVIAEDKGRVVLARGHRMPGARFFPEARLNFAENLLRRRGPADALVFWAENQLERRLSHDELYAAVSRLEQALRALGVRQGDRVAGCVANTPEAVIAMLATASLGAVWSSCSPDFGAEGVVDRFGQIEPKVLFCTDAYVYKGKLHNTLNRVAQFTPELPTLEHIVVTQAFDRRPDISELRNAVTWADLLAPYAARPITFTQVPFNSPLYILYSSGTTGRPKCIVHGVGGTLLQHLKEHQLLCDVRPRDRLFYFTTCGWMMWNWLVSALASEATLLLYDGSPVHPDDDVLWRYAATEKATLFGTSAKYIDRLRKAKLEPGASHDLSALRTITSTGSPLAPEGFDYVYERIKSDVCLSSISGGTDIIGCFVGGNPIGPVWRGEIQARCLGMAVDVFDDAGKSLRGQSGELVCRKPFPSMPLGLWNDPNGLRYHAAYFAKYPGVWAHGDYATLTDHDGVIIHGRSDAVLNPGGVRIGTAEIYRQVERLDQVEEAIAVGQQWQGDERIILFVKLRPETVLDASLIDQIKQEIRQGASPHHVPAMVVQVPDIPRTKSGKIVELAVRDLIHGRPIRNVDALANPEALEHFRDLGTLQE